MAPAGAGFLVAQSVGAGRAPGAGPCLCLPPPARRCPCSFRGRSPLRITPKSGNHSHSSLRWTGLGSVTPGGAWFARGHRQELIVLLLVRGGKSSERQPRGRGVLDGASGGGQPPRQQEKVEGSSSSSVQAGLCAVHGHEAPSQAPGPPSTRLLGAQVLAPGAHRFQTNLCFLSART